MPSVFSRIVARELPSHGVYEDEAVYAFLDINPVAAGHTMVIPKVEVDEFFALDPLILAHLMKVAQPIAAAIKRVTGVARIGAVVAGFDVPHAHLHLIPVNSLADLDFRRARAAKQEELREMADNIRRALAE
ncbi:MAG: HIT family protein [Thermaerobacter sp.]|nr:HIT family protein [Thermaerobacter sp.]